MGDDREPPDEFKPEAEKQAAASDTEGLKRNTISI